MSTNLEASALTSSCVDALSHFHAAINLSYLDLTKAGFLFRRDLGFVSFKWVCDAGAQRKLVRPEN